MEQQTRTTYYSLEQYRRDSMALRQKLGIVGNKMTEEQKKTYLKEQRELWLAGFDPEKLERIRQGLEPSNEY
jgi:hypothetical protein